MPKKILIIEDDANILYSLQAKLSAEGFSVKPETGNSGVKEILLKLKLFKPDYVILDLMLPLIDGFDMLSAIKADSEISGVPVFIFTNLSDSDSKVRSEKLGADYYFIKSDFAVDEFVAKFKKIIKNKKI